MGIAAWVRYRHGTDEGFGRLEGDAIAVHRGQLFARPEPTGERLPRDRVQLLMPVQPGKVLALWNNFGQLAAKLGLQTPPEPLYFLKSPNSWTAHGETVRRPRPDLKLVFEGELGIVIGRRCQAVAEADALAHVFGYTCANDVTAVELLHKDPSFPQWTRAKGFDTFCPLGPCVATGLDPATLRVRTTVNGDLRQDYPISDMRFSVAQLVSAISHDLTLEPGDVILCGTSVGAGSIKPGATVAVSIEGIGTLVNPCE